MKRSCALSHRSFDVPPNDVGFYEKVDLPLPTACPEERLRRRLTFRNERNLYYRYCDATKQRVISFYSPDQKFPVYNKDYWWSDAWDGRKWGRPFDFNRGFFEQFFEMRAQVPRMNMVLSHCENCDYAPYSFYSKNCYRVVSCNESEDTHYSYQTNLSRDCMDCALCQRCELCYQSLYCINCYNLRYSKRCENCADSWFLQDCIGCHYCFGCTNLRNKEYYFLNEPLGKEEYFKKLAALGLNSNSGITKIQKSLSTFLRQFPTKHQFGERNENVTGYNIHQSRDSISCFDAYELENCNFIYVAPKSMKDSLDCNYSPSAELCIDSMSAVNGYANKFMLHSWDVKNSDYCEECFYSNNLFGCVGLKRAEYCILNTQYSPNDYAELRSQIIQYMKTTNEWGEYFPASYSPFSYNESVALDHFPLTKGEAEKKNWRWKEPDKREFQKPTATVPDKIRETTDAICAQLLACSHCQKNYKIQKMELAFYRKMELPVPTLCPDCRYVERLDERGRWYLHARTCFRCKKELMSALPETLAEQVACEDCYPSFVQ